MKGPRGPLVKSIQWQLDFNVPPGSGQQAAPLARCAKVFAVYERAAPHPAQIVAGVVTEGRPKYSGLHALRHFYADTATSWHSR
jgi:hypothetical protein